MMNKRYDVDLRPYNSFGLRSTARLFCECSSIEELDAILREPDVQAYPFFVLGGGSNVVFNDRVDETIIKLRLEERSIVAESAGEIVVRFGAGVPWHSCVEWAVDQGLGGIENMALIPGTIGASPIQNIGAYGSEFKDVAIAVEYYAVDEARVQRLSAEQCAFGYRDSIFKHALRGKAIIVAVEIRLQKQPTVSLAYKDVQDYMAEHAIAHPGVRDVFDAVVAIRTRKLPQPSVLGNAGSFFKNPVVSAEKAAELLQEYPAMPVHDAGSAKKLSAGWLIEQCGLKGARRGDAGVYEKHSLVLVNHGAAKGSEIIALAREIQGKVARRFGVELDIEVNIIGRTSEERV